MRAALRRVLWFFLPGWGTEGSPRLDQDWRLRAAFDVPHGVADVFERLRGRERVLGSEVGGLLSCLVGRLDRPLVERPLRDFAQRRGLTCTIEEKPRLLSVRLTFSVSGPAFKLDEFADYLRSVVRSNWFGGGTGP